MRSRTNEEAEIYNWKAKYGGMDLTEAKRLKALEEENAGLQKLLAEQMLDIAALRELLSKVVFDVCLPWLGHCLGI